MTVEKLKRYREWKSELEDISSKIDDVKVTDSTEGSQKDFPYILCNHKIEGVADEDSNLLVRKSTLKAQIKEIENFVNGIDDSIIRKAINLKFIEIKKDHRQKRKPAPKWYQVAQQVDCGLSGDGLRMKIKRYLEKF